MFEMSGLGGMWVIAITRNNRVIEKKVRKPVSLDWNFKRLGLKRTTNIHTNEPSDKSIKIAGIGFLISLNF
jgi:hypothetical protein